MIMEKEIKKEMEMEMRIKAVVERASWLAGWGSAKLGTDAGRETAHAGTRGWMGAQGAHRVARTRGRRDLARCHAMPCHACVYVCVMCEVYA